MSAVMPLPPKRRTVLGLGLATLLARPAQAQDCGPAPVSFPVADPNADPRRVFPLQLLQLALGKAGCRADVDGRHDYTQRRALSQLRLGQLDVTLVGHRQLPASDGLVVPVPIRQGLLGLRLLLCLPEQVETLARLRDADQLKPLAMGYGVDWNDRPVFEQLGYRLVTTPIYASLFPMLRAHRFDYLSRGVNEVWEELDLAQRRGEQLSVVPGVALSYPLDDYFVVRPDAPALAEALLRGLQQARRDGSYRALFDQHFSEALRRSQLPLRRLLPVRDYPADELVQQAQQQLLARLGVSAAPVGAVRS